MQEGILILSDMDDDLHAVALKSELQKRGEHVICFNPSEIVRGRVAFESDRSRVRVSSDTAIFSSDTIKSVLYRRPSPIPQQPNVEADYRTIVREEWIAFVRGLWELLDHIGCLWVSPPANIQRAELKLRQLALAQKLGLRVPRTLVTNEWEALRRFFCEVGSKIAMKKLRSHCIATGDHSAIFVTRLLDSPSLIAKNELALCPLIFQEYIPKVCDVRLVAVGDAVFAFKIFSQSHEATTIDYRAGKETTQQLVHEHYIPPPEIANACRAMLRDFGLRFGAFDFVISDADEHFFLELNPNGQWLWLQLATQASITDAFCDLLTKSVALRIG